MKNHFRLSILLWVLCLLLCITGCGDEIPVAADTQPHITETTAAPATVPIDPVDTYMQAVDALGVTVGIELKMTQAMTVAGQTFTSSCTQHIGFWDLDGDTFFAKAENITNYGGYEYTRTEFFSDGTVYQLLNGYGFAAEMEAESFLARYPALRLFDPSLYSVTADNDGRKIHFRDATAIESWLVEEDAVPISVEASALLDANGKLSQCSYGAEYTYGPAHYVTTYNVTYSNPGDPVSLPGNISEFATVEDIDGMWLLDHAYGYLLQAKQFSSTILSSIQSQAAGFGANQQLNINSFANQEKTDYRLETDHYFLSSEEDVEQKLDEKFINGKYTSTLDDGEPESYDTVTADFMDEYVLEMLSGAYFDTAFLTDAEITDLGSLYLVEYTCTEDMALSICDDFNIKYLGESNVLHSVSSSYQTNTMDYYLALDKYTMLPTACGYLYEGCHTIEGYECLLTDQYDQSFDLASLTAYQAIYEETSPDTEPESKATPLFYHVTGADGQEMWLFGTIHVGDDRTAFLPQEIYDALLSSDALAVECDSDAFDERIEKDEKLQEQVSSCYFYSGSTVADHLNTEGLHENAVKAMKATGSYFYNSEYQKAALWANTIDNFYLRQGHSLLSEKGLESRLEKLAKENNIPLREVESSLFQIEMMTSYSDHLQEFMLYSSAYSHGKDGWEGTQELYELWCSGDEEALIEEMKRETWEYTEDDLEESEDMDAEDLKTIQYIRDNMESINAELEKIYQEYVKTMESDRNAGMLEAAKEYLESGGTVFFAVGLAHLLAEDGLVFTLRDAGYTVELVQYN